MSVESNLLQGPPPHPASAPRLALGKPVQQRPGPIARPAADAACELPGLAHLLQVLAAYAQLYGRVERKLFADFSAGEVPASLKKEYLERYGIPARMFNGLRVSLEGQVSAVQKTMGLRLDNLQRRIARAELEIAKAVERGRLNQVHQKRRRLANLRFRLAVLEADVAAGRLRLCFGSKRLWRKQHDLEVNGYGNHEEWLSDWRDARSDEFFTLGSRDETTGCQLCVATIAEDGCLNLRVRMPDALAEQHGKYLLIQNV